MKVSGLLFNRRVLLALAVILAIAVASAGSYLTVTRVAVFPGLKGCRYLKGFDDKRQCVGARGAEILRRDGLRRGLTEVGTLATADPKLTGGCHPGMHIAAHKLYGSNADTMLRQAIEMPRSCATYGFIHGIIETAVARATAGSVSPVIKLCGSLAAGQPGRDAELARECYHGMGHGFETRSGLKGGLESCTVEFERSLGAQDECYTGALMQDSIEHRGPDTTKTPDDLFRPCSTFPVGRLSRLCYAEVPDRSLGRFGLSPEGVVELCKKIEEPSNRGACMYATGMMALTKKPALCSVAGTGADYQACVQGFVTNQMQGHPISTPKTAGTVCEGVAKRLKIDCAAGIGIFLYSMSITEEITGTIPPCSRWFDGREEAACEAHRSGEAEPIQYVHKLDPT